MDKPILYSINDRPIDYTLIDQLSFRLSDAPIDFILNGETQASQGRRLLEDGSFRLFEDDGFRLLQ